MRRRGVNKIDAETDSAIATNVDVKNPRVHCLYIADVHGVVHKALRRPPAID